MDEPVVAPAAAVTAGSGSPDQPRASEPAPLIVGWAPSRRTLPVPGWTDDWTSVTFSLRRAIARVTAIAPHRNPQPPADPDSTPDPVRRDVRAGHPARQAGRRLPVVLVTAGALVLAGAGVAVAQAHKAVTLDVDGEVSHLGTFSGTVAGLLDSARVEVAAHDALTPAASEPADRRHDRGGAPRAPGEGQRERPDEHRVVDRAVRRRCAHRAAGPRRRTSAWSPRVPPPDASSCRCGSPARAPSTWSPMAPPERCPAAHDVAAALAAAGVTVGARRPRAGAHPGRSAHGEGAAGQGLRGQRGDRDPVPDHHAYDVAPVHRPAAHGPAPAWPARARRSSGSPPSTVSRSPASRSATR